MSHIPYSVRQIPRSMLNQSTQGPKGLKGERGIPGQDGNHGNHGQDGQDGPPGPQGIQGIQGVQGIPGNDGPPGPPGIDGPKGIPGNDGNIGRDGSLSTLETFIVTSDNVNVFTNDGVSITSVATPMYHINGVKQSDLKLTTGFTYRFDTSDSSNQGHTLNFSYLQGATNQSVNLYVAASKYTSSVSFAETNGSVIASGTTGSYTEITITESTPEKLYYYGESGMHYTQHTTGGLQKITHSTLRTQLVPDITYSNSSHNGETRTNKFLKAINADGSQAQWVAFNEGNNAIPQILCGQVSASSGFFSSLTGSVISSSTVCAVNELSASGAVDFTAGNLTIGKSSTATNTIQGILKLGRDGQNSFRMYKDNNNYNNVRFRVGGNDIFSAVNFALYQFKDIRMTSGAVMYLSSDDRYKHNEVDIKNGLEMIRILNPQTYDKTTEMLDADYNGDLTDHPHRTEAGFIAQEVAKIPELAYCVSGGETPEEPYYLNYQDLFVYAVAGLKELDAKVLSLEARLAALENR